MGIGMDLNSSHPFLQSGGIGRRGRLKIYWAKTRVSSNLTSGTRLVGSHNAEGKAFSFNFGKGYIV